MFEMVHDGIEAGETTVVSTAAVLRCGKQIGFNDVDWFHLSQEGTGGLTSALH
jgi:hypothetical protein